MSDKWKEGDVVNVVQAVPGGRDWVRAKNVKITKVSRLFVTLANGEQFSALHGYIRGATRTRGIGRAHCQRIEKVS